VLLAQADPGNVNWESADLLWFLRPWPRHYHAIITGLTKNRTRCTIGVGEAIDWNADILQHGGPEVGERRIFFRGHTMLTVFEPLESAAGEQAGHIRIPVSGSKAATTEVQAVVEDRSAVGIQWILASNSFPSGETR
jgi:hypothetical protein